MKLISIGIFLQDNNSVPLRDIELIRGDSHPINLIVLDLQTREPVDITDYSILMTASSTEEPTGITTQLFQVVGSIESDQTTNTGEFSMTPTTLQTDQTPGTHYYDIQLVDGSGDVQTPTKFELVVTQDITKSVSGTFEHTEQFDNDDLESNVLTVTHGLGNGYPVVTVYNGSGELVSVEVVPIDENSYTIDLGGAITGTWLVTSRLLAGRHSQTFDDTDLVANVLTVIHTIGTAYPAVAVYNNDNELVDTPVLSIDNTSFSIDFSGTITGTWHLTAI